MIDVFNENPFGDFEQFTRFYGSLEENCFQVQSFNPIRCCPALFVREKEIL